MPAELGSLLIRVGASVADFTSDMRRVEQQATKSAKSAQASMAGIGRALAAGVVTGATAAATGVQIAINKMDALNDSAKSLGLSVTTLTELGFAAEQSGSSVSTLAQGFRKLAVFQGEVAGGNKDAVELARRLGVSMVEVNGDLRDQGEVFADLAERFKGYKDGAGETALAAKLLGRAAGPELLQLLNQGKGGVVALRDEARALSASLGTEAAASAAQFNDNLDKLKTLTSGLFQQLAVQLLPMLLAFSELLVQSGKDANAAAGGFSFITKTFRVLAVGAAIVKNTLEAVVGILAATATTISNFVEATTVSLGVWGNAIKANIEGGPLAGFRALVEGTRASGERQVSIRARFD